MSFKIRPDHSDGKKYISVVVSAFNEEGNVDILHEKLSGVLKRMGMKYEIVFVNDGSTDHTLQRLQCIVETDSCTKVVNLLANYGHEIAMTAGMDYAEGDGVLFMDADLQHPPEIIPEMINEWRNGCDLVLAKRLDNQGQSLFEKFRANLFYRVLNYLSNVAIPAQLPDFRLIDRRYINVLKTMRENNRMFRGLVSWLRVPNTKTIEFVAPPRYAGKSKYSLYHLVSLAVDSIVSFSIKPLRLATYLGISAALFSIILGVIFTIDFLTSGTYERTGYGTTIVMVIFIGSIQLIVLGIIGEYLGRIHIEVKKRPLYIAEFYTSRTDDRGLLEKA